MPKTADEIHKRGGQAFAQMQEQDGSGQLLALLIQTALMLEEIACQLAEMNQRQRDKFGY